MSTYRTDIVEKEDRVYSAGTLVASAPSERTRSVDVADDPECGIYEWSGVNQDVTNAQKDNRVMSRTVKQMQWFNPQQIEKVDEAHRRESNSKTRNMLSSNRVGEVPRDSTKAPSQTEFRTIMHPDRPHMLTPTQAISQPRQITPRSSTDPSGVTRTASTGSTSYTSSHHEPAYNGASADTRAAYLNNNVSGLSSVGTNVYDNVNEARKTSLGGKETGARQNVVWSGSYLWKVPFNNDNAPRVRWFRVVHDVGKDGSGVYLKWTDPQRPRKSASDLFLGHVNEIVVGQVTNAFFKQVNKRGANSLPPQTLCFSLITNTRTLDLAATEEAEYDQWVKEMRVIVNKNKAQKMALSERSVALLKSKEGEGAVRRERNSVHDEIQSQLPRPGQQKVEQEEGNENKLALSSEELRRYWRDTLFDHCRHNRVTEVQGIINEGCPIDLMERESGDTALMVACRRGRSHIVKFCLGRGAKNDPHPQYGQTALQAAVASGQAKCAKIILQTAAQHKMDVVIVNHADPMKDSPLHVAARMGDTQTMEVLLQHGADYKLVDAKGRRPLHVAAAHSMYKSVALLVDVVDNLDIGEYNGNTALHLASTANDPAIVKLLLDTAADPRCVNTESKTPLTIALELRHMECATLLKAGMAHVLGTPRPEPFLSRCLKPEEDVSPSARPMYNPASHNALYSTKISDPHRHGLIGYVSDYQSNYYTDGEHMRPINDPLRHGAPKRFQSELFAGLDIAGVPSKPIDQRINHHHLPRRIDYEGSSSPKLYDQEYFVDPYYVDVGSLTRQSSGVSTSSASSWGDYSASTGNGYDYSTSYLNDDEGTGVYIYTDEAGTVWECKYTEENYPYYLNGMTGESQWDDPCPSGYNGWHEMTMQEWNAWQNTSGDQGQYEESGGSNTECSGDYECVGTKATLGQKVRAQLARQREAKKSKTPRNSARGGNTTARMAWDGGTNAVATVRMELERARQASKDAESIKTQLGELQQKTDTEGKGDSLGENLSVSLDLPTAITHRADEGQDERVVPIDPKEALMAAIKNRGKESKNSPILNMKGEGVSQGSILQSSSVPPQVLKDRAPPTIPPPQLQSTSGIEREVLKTNNSLLKFFKMEKMGVPLAAIKHKMVMDGIAAEVIAIFCGDNADVVTTASSNLRDPQATVASIEQKRNQLRSQPGLEKFFKMEKMGLPVGAIRHKMTMDGIADLDICIFCRDTCNDVDKTTRLSGHASPAKAMEAAKAKLELRREEMKGQENFQKYFKMEKMGLPSGAIRGKMTMDQISPSDIAAFCLDTPQIAPPKGPSAANASIARKMMTLHWDTIPKERLHNSVWGQLDTSRTVDEEQVDELEKLFCAKTPQNKGKTILKPTRGKSKGARQHSIGIDGKRLHNIEIGLAQFRAFTSYEEIVNAVCTMDESMLGVEKLGTLYDVSPSAQEVEVLKKASNVDISTCGKAEKWLLAASKVPRFIEKVDTFRFKLTFTGRAKELAKSIQYFTDVCKKVKTSKKLMSVLQSVLKIGNIMNKGTHAGGACGFKLDSLMKLTQTKSHDKKTSILDFLIQSALESDDPSKRALVDFPNDLDGLEHALKMNISRLKSDFGVLEKGVRKMSSEGHKEAALVEDNAISPRSDQYVSACQVFVSSVATKVVTALEGALDDVVTEEASIVAYFGEDPLTSSTSRIFDILFKFSSAYKTSAKAISDRLERKKRAERKAKERGRREPLSTKTGSTLKEPNVSPSRKQGNGPNLLASIKAKGGIAGLREAARVKEFASPNTMQRHGMQQSLIARLISESLEPEDAKSLALKLMKGSSLETISQWLEDDDCLYEAMKGFNVQPKISMGADRAKECREMLLK